MMLLHKTHVALSFRQLPLRSKEVKAFLPHILSLLWAKRDAWDWPLEKLCHVSWQ